MSQAFEEKTVSLGQSVVVLLVVVAILIGAGYFVGKRFFWDQYDQRPIYEKQVEAIEDYSKKNPESNNAKVLLFDKYFGMGKHAEARKLLDALNKDIASNPDIKYRNALLLQVEGKRDQALAQIKQVVDEKPLFPYARVLYAQLLVAEKNYDEALEEMKMALKIMPVAADLHLEISKIYLAKGDKNNALQSVDKALRMVPDYPEALEVKKQINELR